ncbi:MAG: TatD family hydrolase [Candidatus Paceibacterota bacterium]|jgi:TatD DNase family protein
MIPKYIDIHSHVNFKAFDEDRDVVIKRALENNTWVINAGTQIDTSKKAIELAHQYEEGVYAAIGLHPIHTDASFHDEQELGPAFAKTLDGQGKEGFVSRGEDFDKDIYLKFAKDSKVVAIGECGLDYYHLGEEQIEKQKKVFIEQIKLANEVGKPLVLHIRDAYSDTISLLKEYVDMKDHINGLAGVVHFFAGTWKEAQEFLDLGFMLSFTGVITFPPRKNGKNCNYEEIIKNIPLDMILSDTDSPYLAPVPFRGKRNEPVYVREIVKKIAEIKNLTEEEMAKIIISNAKRLFDI